MVNIEKKYIIVKSADLSKFEDLVNDFILKGYMPCGGVSTYYSNMTCYCQAMILKEKI